MKEIHPTEGFFIESNDGLIFDVKGISHPPDRIIAFIRYIPQEIFKEQYGIKRQNYFKIYDLSLRYNFLKKNFPEYLYKDPQGRGDLQAVPNSLIKKIFDPRKKLTKLIDSKKKKRLIDYTITLVTKIVKITKINFEDIGVTGSILVNLEDKDSDIDLVIYGKKNGLKVYQKMDEVFAKNKDIRRYTKKEIKTLIKSRGQEHQLDFEDFYRNEKQKNLQGMIANIDFYIRLVPYPYEITEDYRSTKIEKLGEIEIKATISNDEQSIFTPCVYDLESVEVINKKHSIENPPERIYSLRGRYCEIAKMGERIKAKGELEKITTDRKVLYQLFLGINEEEYFHTI